jgi:hypothetical protein
MTDRTTSSPESIWFRTRPVGNDRMVSTTGGVAAPLLAGFCLAAIAQLVSADDPPNTTPYGIAFFAAASVCLLNALQLSAIALGYWASPSQRLDYYPEARFDDKALAKVRDRQWQETRVRLRYVRHAGNLYNAGLVGFLVGLMLILVPDDPWPWPWVSIITVLVVALAIVLELVWAISGSRRPRWLLPDPGSQPAPTVDPERIRSAHFGEASSMDAPSRPAISNKDAAWDGLRRQLDDLWELRRSGRLSAMDAAVGRYRALRRAQQVNSAVDGSATTRANVRGAG